jgi:glutathione peroxidase
MSELVDTKERAGLAPQLEAADTTGNRAVPPPAPLGDPTTARSVYEFSARTITGEEQSLGDYAGRVLLVVNVASRCGFTPQYDGLEKLWQQLRGRGLTILGFPCNQFAFQEPGDEAQIQSFCSLTYGVTFPLFAKVLVNGAEAHPLYRFLRARQPGIAGSGMIKWNFTKFLVDRQGQPVRRYGSVTTPAQLREDIEALLAQPAAA